jgi:hypothetical protein
MTCPKLSFVSEKVTDWIIYFAIKFQFEKLYATVANYCRTQIS